MIVNLKSSIRKKSQGDYPKNYVSSAKRGVKEKLFIALAVLMLCACSSDDELESTYNGANATGSVAYLTVNLKDVNTSTRATSDGGYVSGTDAEQKVANVYFYFYDENGDYVARGNVGSTSGTGVETGTNTNIEWGSGTVVAVWGLEPDNEGNLPTKMLTVINQPSGFNIANKTLSEATQTLAGTPYADASGNFVMSTSTYYSSGIVNTTTLEGSDFRQEPLNENADYPNGGVDVYVERLAAKVGVDVAEGLENPFQISITNAGSTSLENGVYVQLLGWNVDCTARDAYISKDISGNSNWNGFYFVWNGSSDHRCYWGESPNYGDDTVIYPTSSNGNTATQENSESTWLNKYLRYVDLNETVEFGQTTYCGENTNTAGTSGVIKDANSTALTNVLVKAQAGTYTDETFTPINLVEYGGSFYTVDDFCQNYISDNVSTIVDDFIEQFSAIYNYNFSDAIYNDGIYLSDSVSNHKIAFNSTISNFHSFGGDMLSLYNANDGNINAYYKGVVARYGDNGDGDIINKETIAKYLDSDVIYSKDVNFGNYELWVKVDYDKFTAGAKDLEIMRIADGSWYLPIDNTITFNVENNLSCTWRNYFLSILTDDADYANTQYASTSSYPNYYNEGLMYYHVPIEHLGLLSTAKDHDFGTGDYGVVRNHWYDITINSITSMGRGIAQPTEVIVPIGDNGIQTTSIGASTKIYSWKEYDQTVIF